MIIMVDWVLKTTLMIIMVDWVLKTTLMIIMVDWVLKTNPVPSFPWPVMFLRFVCSLKPEAG